ncbi:MAG: hypothetical protein ABR589_13530, partial [Chthoniobacterales bacterium]
MKLYKVILHDGREEFVPADDYQKIEDEYRLFAHGQPVSDVFFVEAAVAGITVETDNYERDSDWRRP